MISQGVGMVNSQSDRHGDGDGDGRQRVMVHGAFREEKIWRDEKFGIRFLVAHPRACLRAYLCTLSC